MTIFSQPKLAEKTPSRGLIYGLAIAVLLGIGAVLWADDSPRLPGIHKDGVQYLEAARSLESLRPPTIPLASWSSVEASSPLSHYPPGFSAVLAVPIAAGLNPIQAAEIVMAGAAGATLALALALGWWLAGPIAGLLSLVMVAFSPEWLRVHTAVWSEPLYLALTFATLFTLLAQRERTVLHGLLALLCTVVRYVGVSVAVTAAIVAWRDPRPGRVKRTAFAALPSFLFLATWTVFARAEGSDVRRLDVNPFWAEWAPEAPRVLLQWAAPRGGSLVGAAALLVMSVLVVRSPFWRTPRGSAFRGVAGWLAIFHLAVVVASRAFLDPLIPMDARIVLPVLLLAGFAIAASVATDLALRRWTGGAGAASIALWATLGARTIWQGVASYKETGQYYTHVLWPSAAPIRWAVEAGTDLVYSNEPELLYLYTGKPARYAPIKGDDLAAWRDAWRARPGPLVMINPAHGWDLPADSLIAGLGLTPVTGSSEGVVLWRTD